MSSVVMLNRWVARAIVVEQLNNDQWHTVPRGWPLPEGEFGSAGSGVCDYEDAVADALSVAEVTGLPVLVDAYGEPLRALREVMS